MQASLLLLALLTFRHVCLAVRDRELIGWSERLQRVQDTTGSKLGELKSSSLSPTGAKLATRLEVISWEPRIFLLHDALSEGKLLIAFKKNYIALIKGQLHLCPPSPATFKRLPFFFKTIDLQSNPFLPLIYRGM